MNRKSIRSRGKLSLSKYFQKLEEGDNVAVIIESSMQPKFPKKLQGKTGVIESQRGKTFVVKIKDQAKTKKFLIDPIHLKKIKTLK